jgi:MtN3 and saliva related transmembrane protein
MTKDLIIGYSAAFLTMIAFIPTLYDIYKRGNANHISMPTTILYMVSLILWVIHGLRVEDWPLVIQCTFSGIIQFIIFMLIIFKSK